MRLSLLCVPSCGHSLHSDLTALLGDSLQASKKYLATLCCLLSTLWMFRHYKEVWLIELRCLLERQIFFKKNFDNKDWLVNVVLRTSHQACIYNECDVEATGGDSVDLRKGIVYIRMTFFCCLFSQLYLRLILNIGMLLKISHKRAFCTVWRWADYPS